LPLLRRIYPFLAIILLLSGCAFRNALNRGNDFAQQGKWRKALVEYQSAQKMDPDDEEAKKLVAHAKTRAIQLSLTDGSAALAQGGFEDAMKHVRYVQELDRKHARARQLAADTEAKMTKRMGALMDGDTLVAYDFAVRSRKLFPSMKNLTANFEQLRKHYYDSSDKRLAAKEFELALSSLEVVGKREPGQKSEVLRRSKLVRDAWADTVVVTAKQRVAKGHKGAAAALYGRAFEIAQRSSDRGKMRDLSRQLRGGAPAAHQPPPSQPPPSQPLPSQPPQPQPPPPTPKERARKLLKEGVRLIGEADYAAALERFKRAQQLYPSPKLLINIGTTLRYLGNNAEAARAYEAYLVHPKAQPKRKAELKRILGEIDLVVGKLTIRLFESSVSVRLDGRLLQPRGSRIEVRVAPGEHTIVAEKLGKLPAVRNVTLSARQQLVVELRLDDSSGGQPKIVIVEKAASAQPIVGLAIAGVGLAGLGLAAAFGVLAADADKEAAARCANTAPSLCDEAGAALGDTAVTRATVSTVSFVLGGATVVAGATVFLTSPREGDSSSNPDGKPATLTVSWSSRNSGASVGLTVPW